MVKVLFVDSTVIGEKSATGSTLVNMTRELKECTILQYCIDYAPEYHTPYYETVYEKKMDSPLFFFIKSLYRKLFVHQSLEAGEIEFSNNDENVGKVASFGRLFLDFLPHRIGKENLDIIKNFHPDVIYALGSSFTNLKMVYHLSKILDVPVVIHFMDDWYATKYLEYPCTAWANKSLKEWTKKVITRTELNLGISEKMARHYEPIFGKPFNHAMNCIDRIFPGEYTKNDKLRLIFSGGLHGGRAESIRIIAETIRRNQLLAENMELEVYTSPGHIEAYQPLLGQSATLQPYVPQSEMVSNLQRADVLVHVESFEQKYIDFFRYSLSTKIPECLSVGRPIFCFGPLDIGSVSYIRDKGVGLVATQTSEIESQLLLLYRDYSLRKEMAENALRIAENEHIAEAVADTLKKTFEESKNKWSMG